MSKEPVTARRSPGTRDHYSWVWVIPLRDGRFRIRTIEVPRRLVDEDVDFADDDMTIVRDEFVDEVDAVDDAVRRADVDPEDLDAPWHNDFPL